MAGDVDLIYAVVEADPGALEERSELLRPLGPCGLVFVRIEAHLQEIYGVKVGRDLISRVTDAVLDDVAQWQSRPLERLYPIV